MVLLFFLLLHSLSCRSQSYWGNDRWKPIIRIHTSLLSIHFNANTLFTERNMYSPLFTFLSNSVLFFPNLFFLTVPYALVKFLCNSKNYRSRVYDLFQGTVLEASLLSGQTFLSMLTVHLQILACWPRNIQSNLAYSLSGYHIRQRI